MKRCGGPSPNVRRCETPEHYLGRAPMSTQTRPTAFGRIFPPRADWLACAPTEEVLDPFLAIVDTHHHLWRAPGRYLVDDLFADTLTGHNIEATVFVECRQAYHTSGPVEL